MRPGFEYGVVIEINVSLNDSDFVFISLPIIFWSVLSTVVSLVITYGLG